MEKDNKNNLVNLVIIIVGFLLILLLASTLPTNKEMLEKLKAGEITEEQYWEWVDEEKELRAEWPY